MGVQYFSYFGKFSRKLLTRSYCDEAVPETVLCLVC